MRTIITACILATALAAPAAAVDYLDVRLGGGVLSNDFRGDSSVTVTSGGTATSTGGEPEDADHNYRGQLQLVWGDLGPHGGLVLGAGVAVNHAQWKGDGVDVDATTPIIDVEVGYGYAVNPNWHFELAPFAGYGRTYWTLKHGSSTDTDENWRNYFEYGAKIGTYWTFPNNFQIGVEVPYLVGHFLADYSYDSSAGRASVDSDMRNQGFGLLLTLGGRF